MVRTLPFCPSNFYIRISLALDLVEVVDADVESEEGDAGTALEECLSLPRDQNTTNTHIRMQASNIQEKSTQ